MNFACAVPAHPWPADCIVLYAAVLNVMHVPKFDAGFNSWFAPAARSAKTDACGRSFAVVSTQVSTVGLRLG